MIQSALPLHATWAPPSAFHMACSLCRSHIDASGTHGLSYRRSPGRIPRHSHLNRLVRDALSNAQIPAILEPQGLSCTKRDLMV